MSLVDLVLRYPEVGRFAGLMRHELWENRHKGDQLANSAMMCIDSLGLLK